MGCPEEAKIAKDWLSNQIQEVAHDIFTSITKVYSSTKENWIDSRNSSNIKQFFKLKVSLKDLPFFVNKINGESLKSNQDHLTVFKWVSSWSNFILSVSPSHAETHFLMCSFTACFFTSNNEMGCCYYMYFYSEISD